MRPTEPLVTDVDRPDPRTEGSLSRLDRGARLFRHEAGDTELGADSGAKFDVQAGVDCAPAQRFPRRGCSEVSQPGLLACLMGCK